MCGALRPPDAGQKAVLMGWVNRRRDLGSIIFIDLRDRTGMTQVVFNRERNPAVHDKALGRPAQRRWNFLPAFREIVCEVTAIAREELIAAVAVQRHGHALSGQLRQIP